jgi:hypothetical protein
MRSIDFRQFVADNQPLLNRTFVAIFVLMACRVSFGTTNTSPRSVQIEPVQSAPGVEVPDDYVQALQSQLAEQLEKTKAFTVITQNRQPQSDPVNEGILPSGSSPPSGDLKLALTIIRFKRGSRFVRMVSGYGRALGAGETKMIAHVQLTEIHSENVLLNRDITASIRGMKPVKQSGGMIVDFYVSSKKIAEQEAINVSKEVEKAASR